MYFWHSEKANTTRHPWLVECVVNVCPEDFEKSLWFPEARGRSKSSVDMQVEKSNR